MQLLLPWNEMLSREIVDQLLATRRRIDRAGGRGTARRGEIGKIGKIGAGCFQTSSLDAMRSDRIQRIALARVEKLLALHRNETLVLLLYASVLFEMRNA